MGTIIGDGITFDDVLLVPQYSEVTPNMIELTTHLTKKIVLNIPMMSAAMDTGYCNRAPHGDRHGSTGRYRYHPQEHVHSGTGRGS